MVSFVESVKHGSFSQAARKLGISASAVSKNVSNLEQAYGVRLIRRTTRTLVPTELGMSVFHRLEGVIAQLESVENEINDSTKALQGNINIQLPRVYGARYVVPLLHEFAQENPEVTFDIILDDRPVNIIEEQIDLAVQIGELDDSNFIAQRLDKEQLTICASPEYLALHGTPNRIEELHEHQCLLLRSQITGIPEKWYVKGKEKRQGILFKSRFIINDGMALVRAADKGMGIIQLPRNMLERSINAGRLIPILQPYSPPVTPIHLVYSESKLPNRVRSLINYLLLKRETISS
ncbi:hypothetical protein BCU68_11320 [Vibrio sp. 10N.286.49.B3]|nr:hypothetical protein BCU68_11320 [Vibrio sp. 10N.286.49.B3]